jgi:hypothetical protein
LLPWLWHDQSNESKPGRVVLCIANLADHEAQGKIEIPQWLRPMSSLNWKNLWSDEAFAMPTDQWDSGWWTLYAQGSQVFVLESVGQ